MTDQKESCVKPSRGPIGVPKAESTDQFHVTRKEDLMIAKVGRPAPDFEAGAFADGVFRNIEPFRHQALFVIVPVQRTKGRYWRIDGHAKRVL